MEQVNRFVVFSIETLETPRFYFSLIIDFDFFKVHNQSLALTQSNGAMFQRPQTRAGHLKCRRINEWKVHVSLQARGYFLPTVGLKHRGVTDAIKTWCREDENCSWSRVNILIIKVSGKESKEREEAVPTLLWQNTTIARLIMRTKLRWDPKIPVFLNSNMTDCMIGNQVFGPRL